MSFNRRFKRNQKRINPIMRKLDFKPDQKDIFEYVYTGFANTPKELDKKTHRQHSKILDILEEISYYKDEDKDARVLKVTGGVVMLEESDYTFLKDCIERVPYRAMFSKTVTKMWDFLDAIPEERILKIEG